MLDYVGAGTEATAIGLLFGINGVIGIGSPFLASAIIENWGGYGAVFYYAGIPDPHYRRSRAGDSLAKPEQLSPSAGVKSRAVVVRRRPTIAAVRLVLSLS